MTVRNRTVGLSVRWGLRRGRYGYVAGSGEAEYRELLAILDRIRHTTQSDGRPAPRPGAANESPDRRTGVEPVDPERIPADRAAGLAMAWGLALQRASPAAGFRTTWSGFDQTVRTAAPESPILGDRRRSARMRLDAALQRNGRWSRASAEIAYLPHEPPERESLDASAQGVAARLERRLQAEPAVAGESQVVLAPGIAGAVVHELIGHCLEGDLEDAAAWLRPGDAVGPSGLTVLDDPRRGRVPWNLDDEGQPTRPAMLVQDGRACGKLHDWRSAVRAGRTPTGHGRRHSFAAPVQPRMGCTFVAAGDDTPEEILRGVERGIYVRRMESASVDVRTGRASFRVTDADTIRGGALGGPLERFTLAIDGRAGLASIDRSGHDLRFDPCIGTCLKDGQPLATSVGAPTIRLGVAEVHN